MAYQIEHIGFSVRSPIEMAQWYERVLGFRIAFSAHDAKKAVAFVEDSSGHSVLELGQLPGIEPLCDVSTHPLQFHIALASDDPQQDADYLVRNGASFIEECTIKRPGEQLLLLKDPWGNSIQLARRSR
jgi:catechol 2,3-dioxygenase-like lactoylglutathione lyase family enzyme